MWQSVLGHGTQAPQGVREAVSRRLPPASGGDQQRPRGNPQFVVAAGRWISSSGWSTSGSRRRVR